MPRIAERPDRLAINLFDLDKLDETIRAMILLDKLDLQRPIRVEQDNIRETAIRFKCDILTAATACDVLQSQNRKLGEPEVRLYLNRGQGWVKIASRSILTVLVNGKAKLNPVVFKALKIESGDAIPLTPQRIEF